MRSEPFVTVTCDKCRQSTIEVGLTTTARGYDERNMDAEVERAGWTVVDGQDICEGCAEEETDSA